MKSDVIRDTKELLETWALWREKRVGGLSYPAECVIGRLMREGAGAAHGAARSSLPRYFIHPRLSHLDRIIACDMAAEWRTAVFARHVLRLSDDQAAREMKISRRSYSELMGQAYSWIAGAMRGV